MVVKWCYALREKLTKQLNARVASRDRLPGLAVAS